MMITHSHPSPPIRQRNLSRGTLPRLNGLASIIDSSPEQRGTSGLGASGHRVLRQGDTRVQEMRKMTVRKVLVCGLPQRKTRRAAKSRPLEGSGSCRVHGYGENPPTYLCDLIGLVVMVIKYPPAVPHAEHIWTLSMPCRQLPHLVFHGRSRIIVFVSSLHVDIHILYHCREALLRLFLNTHGRIISNNTTRSSTIRACLDESGSVTQAIIRGNVGQQ